MSAGPVVAFDLDGTLLDARARQVEALRAACLALDEPQPVYDDFWNLKRGGETTAGALHQVGYGRERAGRLSDWWVLHVEDEAMQLHDTLLPGAVEALDACRHGKFSARILTARSQPQFVRQQLARHKLLPLTDQVAVVSPANASAEKAAILLQWEAVVLIGDTESDAQAAQLATVPFMAVTCGQRSSAFLQARGFDVFGNAHRALLAWLARKF